MEGHAEGVLAERRNQPLLFWGVLGAGCWVEPGRAWQCTRACCSSFFCARGAAWWRWFLGMVHMVGVPVFFLRTHMMPLVMVWCHVCLVFCFLRAVWLCWPAPLWCSPAVGAAVGARGAAGRRRRARGAPATAHWPCPLGATVGRGFGGPGSPWMRGGCGIVWRWCRRSRSVSSPAHPSAPCCRWPAVVGRWAGGRAPGPARPWQPPAHPWSTRSAGRSRCSSGAVAGGGPTGRAAWAGCGGKRWCGRSGSAT